MHTAFQLKTEQFQVELNGQYAMARDLLHWGSHDRLGVVVTEAFGGLGASLAIQLAITAYFDALQGSRRKSVHYADIYLFHVGGRWGNFSMFDFWPARREIFLLNDPGQVLGAINSHGITHLLVPDGPRQSFEHFHKEPEAAIDRLRVCLAYSPMGRVVADPDVMVRTEHSAALENLQDTMWPQRLLDVDPATFGVTTDAYKADYFRWRANVESRVDEVGIAQMQRLQALIQPVIAVGELTENYRRVAPEWALHRLGCDDMPFV